MQLIYILLINFTAKFNFYRNIGLGGLHVGERTGVTFNRNGSTIFLQRDLCTGSLIDVASFLEYNIYQTDCCKYVCMQVYSYLTYYYCYCMYYIIHMYMSKYKQICSYITC